MRVAEARLIRGDAVEVLRTLDAGSVHTCVTSPPFFGLRDYGTGKWEGGAAECDHRKVIDPEAGSRKSGLKGSTETNGHQQEGYRQTCGRCGARRIDQQIGLEATPAAFVAKLVEVFREVRRVLRDDGTFWCNLGDSFGSGEVGRKDNGRMEKDQDRWSQPMADQEPRSKRRTGQRSGSKQLLGIPWRVAFALQDDGWILRSAIVWHKPNPMPESVRDRPTKSYEMLFLFAKKARYYYDSVAIAEPASNGERFHGAYKTPGMDRPDKERNGRRDTTNVITRRNKRDVWTVAEPKVRLRRDLSPEQRAYVVGELLRRGLL